MKKSILLIIMMMAVSITASAQRFALIDMEYIFENIPAYQRASGQLEQASQKWQSEVETALETARKLYTDYQNEMSHLSDAEKTKREEEIIAKEKEAGDLRRKYFGPEGEMARQQTSLLKPIEDDIYEAVKEISEANSIALVLDRASATSVIFASPQIDISDEVLARLGYSN